MVLAPHAPQSRSVQVVPPVPKDRLSAGAATVSVSSAIASSERL